jgi:hypothetical protein
VRGRVTGASGTGLLVAACEPGATRLLERELLGDDEWMRRIGRRLGAHVAKCDDDGAFEVGELVPGRIHLTAIDADGATLAGADLELRDGETRDGVVLAVDRRRIRCRVTRAGSAVAHAAVTCFEQSPVEVDHPVYTGADGTCELTVANVRFEVVVRAGREESSRSFDAPPAETIELVLGVAPAVPAAPPLVGRVVGASGADARRIAVTAIRHDAVDCTRGNIATTVANPGFSFRELAPGTWDLLAATAGSCASRAAVTVETGATDDVGELALAGGAVLEVTFAPAPASATLPVEDDAALLVRRGETRLALVLLAPGEVKRLVVPPGAATLEVRRRGVLLDARPITTTSEAVTSITVGAR